MRISDWSSDVCSSDLDAEEEAEAEPEPEEDAAPESDAADGDRREDDADDAAPSIDVVPGNEDESEEPGDAQAGGQKAEGGEPTPGSDEDSFGSKADSGGFGTGPGEQGDICSSGNGGRSEEPTAELQYRMCISYAVL